ncbi:hypothetical protein Tco_0654569 [Tanacetum coccineum]|uniref:Uncharacterized protein n=1 Tax=Tanacetum coccineum TaxID=301880 RepID=A0ABQ4X4H7_9ASTR
MSRPVTSMPPLSENCGLVTKRDWVRCQRAKEVGYGIRDTCVNPREAAEEIAPVTLEGVNTREALVSREAWVHTMGLSSAVHYELQGYRTHAWMQDQRIDAHDSLIAGN